MCLVGDICFLFRKTILVSICFQENCKDFEELRWYESLLFYGFKEGEAIDREDEDVKLLPAIVDKIILPKLSCKYQAQKRVTGEIFLDYSCG